MAAQSAMIMETILNLRRALEKERGSSDSDNELPPPTNRGNKLKRKAEYFHEGQLGGFKPYKKRIEHAGYTRYILQRKPKRYDEEGYVLMSEEEDAEADREAVVKNPYGDVHIEKLLMPLTSAHDLSEHPTLSIPYKSETLPRMVEEALDMVHKERKTLVDMKLLLTKLRGDKSWAPCGDMCTPHDNELFGTEINADGQFVRPDILSLGFLPVKTEPSTKSNVALDRVRSTFPLNGPLGPSNHGSNDELQKGGGDSTNKFDARNDHSEESIMTSKRTGIQKDAAEESTEVADDGAMIQDQESVAKAVGKAVMTGDADMPDAAQVVTTKSTNTEPASVDPCSSVIAPAIMKEGEGSLNNPPQAANSNPPTPSAISSAGASPPRMLTRRRANARAPSTSSHTSRPQTPQSPTASNTPPPPIHPLYLPPTSSIPSGDLGLPPAEADETRRLLHAWVQKQEEVIRGAERLYEGHLKALRMRDTVWRWCRAEKYVNIMSDGEDWVDEEEWGLDGGLEKGQEEGRGEEMESGKKTRGRRVAGG